jgi:hypothetical protein
MLVTDLDIADLYRSRDSGAVTPFSDRRKDLFGFQNKLSNEVFGEGVEGGHL